MEKGERVAMGCISFVELVLCMVYGKCYIRGWSEADLLSVSFFVCTFIYCVAPFFVKNSKESDLIKFDLLSFIALLLIYLLGFRLIFNIFDDSYMEYIAIFIFTILATRVILNLFAKYKNS